MTYQEACQEQLRLEEEIRLLEHRRALAEKELTVMKEQLAQLKHRYYEELADVEQLEKLSFGKLLVKIAGNYEEKHRKEYQEYVSAKAAMDDGECRVEEQKRLIQRYGNDIFRMKEERKALLQRIREEYPEGQEIAELEAGQRRYLLRKRKELQEAQVAASQVMMYAREAREKFSSADSWATWDTFLGGGLLGDLAKYSYQDEGVAAVHRMLTAASQLKKELADVGTVFDGNIDSMEGGIRAWDIMFDNIFTDWSVKERIRGNLAETEAYCEKLELLQSDLNNRIRAVDRELKELDGDILV